MNILTKLALVTCLPILLAACGGKAPDPAPDPAQPASTAPQTALGRTVARALDEAREELATKNISLNEGANIQIGGARIRNRDTSGLPRAEISPQGDLLIDGEAVALDDAQRELSLAYRGHIIAIAEAGMDIGVQGADLGIKAASEVLGSLLRGKTDEFEQRIEAEARKIEASALKLCERMPALLASQRALAASVPAFQPYAQMTQQDVDDCNKDARDGTAADAAATADAAAEDMTAEAASAPTDADQAR